MKSEIDWKGIAIAAMILAAIMLMILLYFVLVPQAQTPCLHT